jgi:hypothetical protein
MSNATKQNKNSFTLRFTNTTNVKRKVSLFEQGSDSGFDLIKVNSAVANATQGTLFLSPIDWNFAANQPFGYPTSLLSEDLPFNVDTNNFRLRANNTGTITYNFGATTMNINGLLQDMTIDEVNTTINIALKSNLEMRSPSGKYVEMYVYFDVTAFNNLGGTYPKIMSDPVTYQNWGISVQYPYDFPSTDKIDGLNLQPGGIFPNEFQNIDTISEVVTASANGIEVNDSGSTISYDEIQQSQNGSVYDIASMSLDIGRTPSSDEADAQMLQPLCYDKRDVNGNTLTYCKVPTKSPYQFQNSYEVLSLSEVDDDFVLDGNTAFSYEVEALSTAILTFNYVKLTNLVADTKLGVDKMKQEKQELAVSDKKRNNKNTITITSILKPKKSKPKNKQKPSSKKNNFSNFKSSSDKETKHKSRKYTALALGVGVAFLFFNKFKNQTK